MVDVLCFLCSRCIKNLASPIGQFVCLRSVILDSIEKEVGNFHNSQLPGEISVMN